MRLAIAILLVACAKETRPPAAPAPVAAPAPAPPPPSPAPTPAPPTPKLPASCDEYKAIILALSRCEKMPAESRKALVEGFEAMEQGWRNLGDLPPEVMTALEDGCRQGGDALRQAAGEMCPDVGQYR